MSIARQNDRDKALRMVRELLKIANANDIDLTSLVHDEAAHAEDWLRSLRCEPHASDYVEAVRRYDLLCEMKTVLECARDLRRIRHC